MSTPTPPNEFYANLCKETNIHENTALDCNTEDRLIHICAEVQRLKNSVMADDKAALANVFNDTIKLHQREVGNSKLTKTRVREDALDLVERINTVRSCLSNADDKVFVRAFNATAQIKNENKKRKVEKVKVEK